MAELTGEQAAEPSLWAWTLYWQDGNLGSFLSSADDRSAVYLRRSWADFFRPRPKAILDLGTGNGALVELAAAATADHEPPPRIVGVDRADIRPPFAGNVGTPQLKNVSFFGGVPMERLPFREGSFDTICGQFALEYSDRDLALREVVRLLSPDGRFRFLVHTSDSAVVEKSRGQARHLDTVLSLPIFERLREVLLAVEAAAQNESMGALAIAQQKVLAFRSLLGEADQRLGVVDDQSELARGVLRTVRSLPGLRTSQSLAELMAKSEELHCRLRAQASRFTDLDRAALDGESLQAVTRSLQANGTGQVRTTPARAAPDAPLLGRWLWGTRTPPT